MKRKNRKNKPLFLVYFQWILHRIGLGSVLMGIIFTSLFPQQVSAQTVDLRDVIWVQSWVPAEFVSSLPVAKERPRRVIWVTVTAYSSTPDQTDDTPFIAASGKHVFDGMIAANFLRFGTRAKFPDYFGDKNFFVYDRMHERFSDRIDIWMETREEAKKFGIRRLKVEIY